MAITALPSYLGNDFRKASPGLRFGMCFQLWGVDARSGERLWTTHDRNYRQTGRDRRERESKDENKTTALRQAARLGPEDRAAMESLAARQRLLAQAQSETACWTIPAKSIAPFATGLGNEHPLENGFSFLNPYGLPYLPGSGVKGVVRQAAIELAGGEWGETKGWCDDPKHEVPFAKGQRPGDQFPKLSMIEVLFGREPGSGDKKHYRGALSFWDVVPQIHGERLAVEIMTPHQSEYYQGTASPHDSGSPNPIPFLTIPPGSSFAFHVACDHLRLLHVARDLAENERWKALLQSAFQHAFEWLGFGAKTAVGYGHMEEDKEAAQHLRQEREEQERRQAAEREQARQEERRQSLSEDAAWVDEKRASGRWSKVNDFLDDVEEYLGNWNGPLGRQAHDWLSQEMQSRWKEIMQNPDAVKGKKRKPRFSDRQRKLAKALIAMQPEDAE